MKLPIPQRRPLRTLGAVDIHFHGAFGIDLMSASPADLAHLSALLWKEGIAGICPTTFSAPFEELCQSVARLGNWIRNGKFPGAKPLGIHLEGPYISPLACGAHPPDTLRKFQWQELEKLWELSFKTLKIITIAPENLEKGEGRNLARWCKKNQVHLSLGHSQATETDAKRAFIQGFRGVTHAWNALPFHHRNPGVLGAALGQKDVFLEMIIDQVHVSPTLLRWTLQLHPLQRICFISDCLAAAGLPARHPKAQQYLGHQPIVFQEGACRLADGRLAGGGMLLTHAFRNWLYTESRFSSIPIQKLLQTTLPHITLIPLDLLGISQKTLVDRKVSWKTSTSGKIDVFPVDSSQTSR